MPAGDSAAGEPSFPRGFCSGDSIGLPALFYGRHLAVAAAAAIIAFFLLLPSLWLSRRQDYRRRYNLEPLVKGALDDEAHSKRKRATVGGWLGRFKGLCESWP